jgi:hypothetical protein
MGIRWWLHQEDECPFARSRRPMRCLAKRVNKRLICLLSIAQDQPSLQAIASSLDLEISQTSLTRGRIGGRYWCSCRMPSTSNVRAVLRLRGTPKLTEPGLRYCANERTIGSFQVPSISVGSLLDLTPVFEFQETLTLFSYPQLAGFGLGHPSGISTPDFAFRETRPG